MPIIVLNVRCTITHTLLGIPGMLVPRTRQGLRSPKRLLLREHKASTSILG